MRTANEYEIAIFKKEYCKNGEARISIGKDFEVDVESFEELLPGKIVSSYATGNRDIENSFIMFRVCDVIKDIQYFPVFSETVGRKMLKSWNKPVPKKRSIFIEDNNGVGRGNGGTGNGNKNNVENSKLRSLILFARSLMILHINDPQPMNATVYKGNIIKNLIMDCQSYTKYRPNETTGGIFVSWRRKEELPTGA